MTRAASALLLLFGWAACRPEADPPPPGIGAPCTTDDDCHGRLRCVVEGPTAYTATCRIPCGPTGACDGGWCSWSSVPPICIPGGTSRVAPPLDASDDTGAALVTWVTTP
jgi:hypothetical protein